MHQIDFQIFFGNENWIDDYFPRGGGGGGLGRLGGGGRGAPGGGGGDLLGTMHLGPNPPFVHLRGDGCGRGRINRLGTPAKIPIPF